LLNSKSDLNSVGDETELKLGGIAEENERLTKQLEVMKEALSKAREELALFNLNDEGMSQPFEDDILSSTLKTTVGKGEVLVTGGYQTADGYYQFPMLQPEALQDNGRTLIRMKPTHFSIKPEVMKELGLDSLSTNAGNTLQHGEIWTSEEFRSVVKRLGRIDGVGILSAPSFTVIPGTEAEVTMDDYKLRATPSISSDGASFDIELRVEQSRVPTKAQPDGGHND